jgi:signal transduction histidine kinase
VSVTLLARALDAPPPPYVGGGARPWIACGVRDAGAGLDEDTRARVFEPFFTTKEVGDGTGLGLSMSWGIVREHGGWIDVASTKGEGATFTVYLPAGAAA